MPVFTGRNNMNVWRLSGIAIFVVGAVFLGTFQAFGGGDAKKVEIKADPDKADLKAGEKKSVDIKLTRGKDATKEVALTVEVDPKDKGVTATVDAKVAGDKSAAKLNIETTAQATEGSYKITVKGKSADSADSSATFTLAVKKADV